MGAFTEFERVLDISPFILRILIDYSTDSFSSDSISLQDLPNQELAVWKFEDMELLIDKPSRTSLDSIFPPHEESIFLSRLIPKAIGSKKFLDVGVGSGILSINAAKKGWLVTAVDINDRAIQCAKINGKLNSVNIEVQKSSLGRGIEGQYQLCVANLPFEPTPAGCVNFIHSDGGEDGAKIIREFIPLLPGILVEGGIAFLPAFSLIKDGKSDLEKIFQELNDESLDRAIIRLSSNMDLSLLSLRFGKKRKVFKKLNDQGYKEFVIEVGIIRKVEGEGSFKGRATFILADESWILPLGYDGIAQAIPEQE